jgi:hypothetical protein
VTLPRVAERSAFAPFLDDGLRAHARRIGRVEALDHHAREGFGLRGQAAPGQIAVERHVPVQRSAAHRACGFGERIPGTKAPAVERALHAVRGNGPASRAAEQGVRLLCLAVQKLRAQLHGDVEARHAVRPAASADALARFQHQHRLACSRQRVRRGQASGAGADDDYVVAIARAWQAGAASSR